MNERKIDRERLRSPTDEEIVTLLHRPRCRRCGHRMCGGCVTFCDRMECIDADKGCVDDGCDVDKTIALTSTEKQDAMMEKYQTDDCWPPDVVCGECLSDVDMAEAHPMPLETCTYQFEHVGGATHDVVPMIVFGSSGFDRRRLLTSH